MRDIGIPFLHEVLARDTVVSWIRHLEAGETDSAGPGVPTGLRNELLEVLETALAFAACAGSTTPGLRHIGLDCYHAKVRHSVGLAGSASEYYQAAVALDSRVARALRALEGGGDGGVCRSHSRDQGGSQVVARLEGALVAVAPVVHEFFPGPAPADSRYGSTTEARPTTWRDTTRRQPTPPPHSP